MPSITSSTGFARAPTPVHATPKKMENTTICRISLSTIGRTAESGNTCLTNPSSVIACASIPAFTPVATLCAPTPGSNRLTSTSPSESDTSEASTNHSIALPPTRPTAPASVMCPMPTTRVENTSGPMIILISRKKIVLPIDTYPAISFSVAGSGNPEWTAPPTAIPPSIAIRM